MTEPYSDIVYRVPGPHSRKGGTYDYKGVTSREEHDAALKNGWFCSLPEAIDGKHALVELAQDAPPTREELEQKAKELGIRFDRKTTDEILSEKINKAMGA